MLYRALYTLCLHVVSLYTLSLYTWTLYTFTLVSAWVCSGARNTATHVFTDARVFTVLLVSAKFGSEAIGIGSALAAPPCVRFAQAKDGELLSFCQAPSFIKGGYLRWCTTGVTVCRTQYSPRRGTQGTWTPSLVLILLAVISQSMMFGRFLDEDMFHLWLTPEPCAERDDPRALPR